LHIPNQVGTSVLDLSGNILSASGDLGGEQGGVMIQIIRNMVLDCGQLHFLKGNSSAEEETEQLERLTVAFPTYQYAVQFEKDKIFIVKQLQEDGKQ
jgi:hypothetical protein